MSSRFLLHAAVGQAVELRPATDHDHHLVGAIARLDVTREEAVVMFRSAECAILLHVDTQSRFSDFKELYEHATGFKETTKCKVIVWCRPAASSERVAAEAQAWAHAHPRGDALLPSYYFPNHGLLTPGASLHLVRYLHENTTQPLLIKLRESGMLEIEEIPHMTNAVVMQLHSLQGGLNVATLEQRTRRGLPDGVSLVKNRYLTSAKLKDACVALEAYQGVDVTMSLNRCQVVSHPQAQLLQAYETLRRFDNGSLKLAPVLGMYELITFNPLDGWHAVDVSAMRSAVQRLPLFEQLRHLDSWVRVHQKLHGTKHAPLSASLVPFLIASGSGAAGTAEQFRREVTAATHSYLDAHANDKDHAALQPLLQMVASSGACPRPTEIHDMVQAAIQQYGSGDFSAVMLPLYGPITAAYVTNTHYDHNARLLEREVQGIKVLCSDAKVYCDSNQQVEEARKKYSAAQDICQVTDMRGSKRSAVIRRCLDACERHSMKDLADRLAKSGHVDSKMSDIFSKFFNPPSRA